MTVQGIVVGATHTGDSHKIIRLLTADRGRISLMARGARASKKRFAGVLDLGTAIEAQVTEGRGGLGTLTQADLRKGPKRARRDLDRIALLAYGCEVCGSLAPEDASARRLYHLLEVWLELLEGAHTPAAASRVAFEAKALTFAGITPSLLRCGGCGDPLDVPTVFDPAAGGGLHGRCGGGRPVHPDALRDLDHLRRTPLQATVEMKTPQELWLLSGSIEEHLGRPLQSKSLLFDLEQMRG